MHIIVKYDLSGLRVLHIMHKVIKEKTADYESSVCCYHRVFISTVLL